MCMLLYLYDVAIEQYSSREKQRVLSGINFLYENYDSIRRENVCEPLFGGDGMR